MTPADLQVKVLLSMQRALVGHIGTAMRAVICRWNADEIHVRAVYDGEISEDDAEAISEAETEVTADFPPTTAICFRLERCDLPAPIKYHDGEKIVFRRLER